MAAKCEDFLIKEATGELPGEENQQIWGEGLAVAIHVLLPLAIAGVLWGRKIILSKILLHLDKACLSVFWPSFSKREKVLKWTITHLPYLDGGLETIWSDGSQLCTLINSVVPGACPNPHRHWKKPPTHGQALAYKYLGVVPVFTDSDFNQKSMNSTIEKSLIEYMINVQNAVSKISHDEELTFSNNYIARGMGLVTGEQYRKTVLYIYPNSKNKQSDNLLINIRGPYNSHGVSVLYASDLAALYKTIRTSQREREKIVDEEAHRSFLKSLTGDFQNLLSVKYNREQSCDIDISIEIERNRAKVMFIPRNSGVYEVCLTTNGEHIAGSPYNINVEKNRSGLMDDLSEDDSKGKSKKRIIPKIIETPPDNKHAYIKYEEREKWRRMRKIRDFNHSSESSNNTSLEEDVCYLTIKKDDDLNNNNNDHVNNLNDSSAEVENVMMEIELPMKQVLLSDLDKMKFPKLNDTKATTVKSQDIRDRIAALENSANDKNDKPKISPPLRKTTSLPLTVKPETADDNNNNISEEVKNIKVNSNALKTIDVFQKIIDLNKPEHQKKITGDSPFTSLENKTSSDKLILKSNIAEDNKQLDDDVASKDRNDDGTSKDTNLGEKLDTQNTINKNKNSEIKEMLVDIKQDEDHNSINTTGINIIEPTAKKIDKLNKESSLESNDSIYAHSINDDDDAKLLKSLSKNDTSKQQCDDSINNLEKTTETSIHNISNPLSKNDNNKNKELCSSELNPIINPCGTNSVKIKVNESSDSKLVSLDDENNSKTNSPGNQSEISDSTLHKNNDTVAKIITNSLCKPETNNVNVNSKHSAFSLKTETDKESQNHNSSLKGTPKENLKRLDFISDIPQGSAMEKRIQRLQNLRKPSVTNLKINKPGIEGNTETTQIDYASGDHIKIVPKSSHINANIETNRRYNIKNVLSNRQISRSGDLKSPVVISSINGSAESLIKDCVFELNPVVAHKKSAPNDSKQNVLKEPASPVFKNTVPEDLPLSPKIQVSDVSTENIKEAQTGKGKLHKWKPVDEPESALTEDENIDLRLSFMKRKEFWSKLSTTSINSLNSSCMSLNYDNLDRRYSSLSRLQVKKPKMITNFNLREMRTVNPQQFRSLDYIDKRRIQRSDSCGIRDRYGSLDDLYFPSVKERRGLFLKEMMQDQAKHAGNVEKQAKAATKELIHKLEEKASGGSRSQEVMLVKKTKNLFGSIHDKIKLFDSGFNPSKKTINSNKCQDLNASSTSLKENWERKLNQLPENGTIKTKIKERFEKAQMFFKTLENVKQHKHEQNLKTNLMRRHSWSSNSVKLEVIKTGGSLRNLSKSERLPLNTLSKDYRNDVGSSNSVISSCSSSGDAKCVDYEELKKLQVNLFLLNNNKKQERKSVNNVFN